MGKVKKILKILFLLLFFISPYFLYSLGVIANILTVFPSSKSIFENDTSLNLRQAAVECRRAGYEAVDSRSKQKFFKCAEDNFLKGIKRNDLHSHWGLSLLYGDDNVHKYLFKEPESEEIIKKAIHHWCFARRAGLKEVAVASPFGDIAC